MPGAFELLLVLGIIILIFGTKKLKNIGTDLGGAISGFKKSMKDDDNIEIENKKSTEVEVKNEVEKMKK